LLPVQTSASSDFTYDTDVVYHVDGDGQTDVTENYRITNNTARYFLTQLKLSTPTSQVTNLNVSYSDGAPVPASVTSQSVNKNSLQFGSDQININFPRQIYGSGTSWSFQVKYRAGGLVDTKGGSHTVFIPSIEPNDGTDQYNVRLEVPTSFGGAHFAGALLPNRNCCSIR
jgi:hypothetical protein